MSAASLIQTREKLAMILSTRARANSRSLAALLMAAALCVGFAASAAERPKTAFLGVELINDNAEYEPTSNAERARMKNVEALFKSQLQEQFDFISVPEAMKVRIATGQSVGECGGCEIDYGKDLGAERIAWIRIQKVSNLILNMNVYMADVASEKMTFVRSVDIRGNTDETWAHSIKWLIKKYLRPEPSQGAG